MNVVVDASVAIKWFLPEENTAEAELLLTSDLELHSPELAIAEFGNIVWKKLRNGDLQPDETTQLIDGFFRVGINFHSNGPLLGAAVEAAIETDRSVYDCTYLALAVALNCPLVTADRKLFIRLRTTRFKDRSVWLENIRSLA